MRRCAELEIRCEVDHIPVGYVPDFVNQHADTHKMFYGLPGYHLKDKQKTERCSSCAMEKVCPGERRDYREIYG